MRAYTQPMLITGVGTTDEHCVALERLALQPGKGDSGYDEAWLQRLIQSNPGLLPVSEIEPGLVPLVPVCMELPVTSGYVDNLMVTPDGGIVVVETKLWRNPEARRTVLSQVLDYAKDLMSCTYEDLERAVRSARKEPGFDLFNLVSATSPEVDEARFIDAIARNLQNGRLLLIVAGDGIQEGAEQLASFLQRHVGIHCTISLIEMSLWRNAGDGSVFVQARVLARTVQIERAVVRVEAGVTLVLPPIETSSASKPRATTLSEEQFYAELGKADPSLARRLADFVSKAAEIGVYAQVGRSLALKWKAPGGEDFHLGVVDLAGQVMTDYCNWRIDQLGRLDLSHAYLYDVAGIVDGGKVKQTAKETGWRVVTDRGELQLADLLAHEDAWLAAIVRYSEKIGEFLSSEG